MRRSSAQPPVAIEDCNFKIVPISNLLADIDPSVTIIEIDKGEGRKWRKARSRHTIVLDHIPMSIGIIPEYGLRYNP